MLSGLNLLTRALERAFIKGRNWMKLLIGEELKRQEGKVGWVLLWLLGIPIPVLLILFLLRGCT